MSVAVITGMLRHTGMTCQLSMINSKMWKRSSFTATVQMDVDHDLQDGMLPLSWSVVDDHNS